MRLGIRLGLVIILLPAFAIVGCSVHKPSHQRLATQAISFNLTVEEAQNEMLLLNVIRAKDRLPMYLTAISSLNGNVSTRLTGGLGGSYSEANADAATVQTASGGSLPAAMSTVTDAMTKTITRGLTPSVGGELSRNPNFTLAVLDGEKFMRGFLTPISQATFAYFWDQGWPPELLLYLLVQRVEEGGEGGEVFNNYPPKPEELSRFAKWVTDFIAGNPRVVRRQVGHDLGGPALPTSAVETLPDLVAAAKEGFVVTQRGTGWHLQRRTSELYLTFSVQGEEAPEDGEAEPGVMRIYGAETPVESESPGGREGRLVLRSPEAVLYYLGELMRVGDGAGASVPHICIQGQYQPLFLAVGLGSCPRALVEARSPWGDYAVPSASRQRQPVCACQDGQLTYPKDADSCDSGRSMQALRLLSQLISLQKSSDELPSPALVRVIGD